MTTFDLRGDGRVALVTGAASGLGRAVAHVFGAAGYRLVVADIDAEGAASTAAALAARGIAARSVVADVASNEAVRLAVDEASQAWGRLDVVLNSAGIAGRGAPIESLDAGDAGRVVDVDLKGSIYVCKHAVRALRAHGGGSIVNVASISGGRGAPGYAAYSAAKAGVIAMTRAVAREVGRFNIRVNCLNPGSIAGTNLMATGFGRPLTALELQHATISLMKKIPIGRAASPEDVAHVALFLASPLARHIHGAVMTIDGGESLS